MLNNVLFYLTPNTLLKSQTLLCKIEEKKIKACYL